MYFSFVGEEEEGGGCDAFRLFQTCANKNLFSASNVPFRAPFGYCRRQVLIDRRADAASLPQIPTRIEEAGNAAPDVGGRFTHSIHPAPDRQSLRDPLDFDSRRGITRTRGRGGGGAKSCWTEERTSLPHHYSSISWIIYLQFVARLMLGISSCRRRLFPYMPITPTPPRRR